MMKTFTSAALLSVFALAKDLTPSTPVDLVTGGDISDAKRSFEEICVENGFKFETHEVTTEDGYILNVFRIPGLTSESPTSKPPIHELTLGIGLRPWSGVWHCCTG